jgi:hypothetical protein
MNAVLDPAHINTSQGPAKHIRNSMPDEERVVGDAEVPKKEAMIAV